MGGPSGADERVQHIMRALAQYREGVHSLRAPAYLLDSELPEGLAAVYRAFDGGELFHETFSLLASSSLHRAEDGWTVGSVSGHRLRVAPDGRVWLYDVDLEEEIEDGSSFDRWLYGAIEAEGLIYAHDGEFRDDVAEDSGELVPEIELERLRAQVKRDRRAIGPRWKLALRLRVSGEVERSRRLLEDIVSDRPEFAWGWFDLSRISADLGEWEGARDEARQAAEVSSDDSARAYFLARSAVCAGRAGDALGREELAGLVLAADPQFVSRHLDGLRDELERGDSESARHIWQVLNAVAPRHLEVLQLKGRFESQESSPKREG